MNFLLWLEALLLFAAAVLAGLGAAWRTPEIVLGTTTLTESAVRAGLGLLTLAFLGGTATCLALGWWRHRLSTLFRQSGPRGQILITPRTVSQLASHLLAQELAETPFRVQIRPSKEVIFLRIFVRLPPGSSIPNLAERIQELLATELAQRTGLQIQEVQVVVHGASPISS